VYLEKIILKYSGICSEVLRFVVPTTVAVDVTGGLDTVLSQTIQRKISEDSNIITLVLRTDGLYVEIKCQLDARDYFYCRSYCLLNMFRAPLCPSSVAREYYTAPHHTDNLKTKAPNTTGSNHLYNTLELLIVVPETC
jgi:hypothetical protein